MNNRIALSVLTGDPNSLRQVLFNLLQNLSQFHRKSERSDHRTWFRFTVTDTGSGINTEQCQLLAETRPLSELADGVGLPLCIAFGGRDGWENWYKREQWT